MILERLWSAGACYCTLGQQAVRFQKNKFSGGTMKYRHLGRTGIQVSELSFGSWVTFHNQAGVKSAVDMMAAAYGVSR